MKLSDTLRGKQWLSQFDDGEQFLAGKILELTSYYTTSDIYNGLSHKIKDEYSRTTEYIAFYPVIDIKQGTDYWGDELNSFSKKWKIGSDGEISHVIRDICKTNAFFLIQPDLKTLKKKKCHILVLVNDINCSGDQIRNFVDWIYQNPTIKSWMSYKKIHFESVCFASTDYGKELLKHSKLLSKNHSSIKINTINDFEPEYKTNVKNLILKYGKTFQQTNNKISALGYNNIGSLVLLSYKNPNTNINLFYSHGTLWQGLCDNNERPEANYSNITNINKTVNSILEKYDLIRLPEKEREFIKFMIMKRFFYDAQNEMNSYLISIGHSNAEYHEKLAEKYNYISSGKITSIGLDLISKYQYKQYNKQLTVIDPENKKDYYIPCS